MKEEDRVMFWVIKNISYLYKMVKSEVKHRLVMAHLQRRIYYNELILLEEKYHRQPIPDFRILSKAAKLSIKYRLLGLVEYFVDVNEVGEK